MVSTDEARRTAGAHRRHWCRQASRASVEELAGLLDTSRETVRRDLTLLSEQGRLRKVHGGAVHFQTALESPLEDRRATARPEKIAHRPRGGRAVPARATAC